MKKILLSGLLIFLALIIVACDFIVGTIELGEIPKYAIVFTIREEFIVCDSCYTRYGEKGTEITLPVARWTGDGDWEFYGWFNGYDETEKYGGGGDIHIITGNAEMVPQFSRITADD